LFGSKYAKRDMMESEFRQRANRISVHGLGLSADVYSPDVVHLVQTLRDEGLRPGYVELFKSTTSAMQWVRRQLPDINLPYHGEGLWVTQPDFQQSYSGRHGVAEACAQVAALGSAWVNHECATKHMAGYAFGTYLPPLYTDLSARMTAENLAFLQEQLDRSIRCHETGAPLILLEMPPLTYFACGSLRIPEFFRAVTDRVACGLVLDIGHLWTVYRYTGAWRRYTLQAFAAEFLDAFPMERVVEIHVAGLAEFLNRTGSTDEGHRAALPAWIDAHEAPIPDVLFDLLAQVLGHSRLTSLKGVALEVDTKPVAQIVRECRVFVDRFTSMVRWSAQHTGLDSQQRDCSERSLRADGESEPTREERATLHRQYHDYAVLVSSAGAVPRAGALALLGGSPDDLDRYRKAYLPHELLHWGGELKDMFPNTCRLLEETQITLDRFIPFWFEKPRPAQDDYDFFLLKIDRFVEFVTSGCPSARTTVREEAEELRAAYRAANEPVGSAEVTA
jgi:uncharacterized protein (UPF0276 family)